MNVPYTARNDYVNDAVWCSYGSKNLVPEWELTVMDLTLFIGQKVQIGFQFTSDNQFGEAGFYVDDVKILWNYEGCNEYTLSSYGVKMDDENASADSPHRDGEDKVVCKPSATKSSGSVLGIRSVFVVFFVMVSTILM